MKNKQQYNSEYWNNNKEFISEKQKLRYNEKRIELLEQKKDYYIRKKEEICEAKKAYYEANKEKINKRKKAYYETNKEKINKQKVQYERERKKIDPLYKLRKNIGTLIRNSINNNGYKKTSSTANILGCSFEEFKQHLESLFEPWMSWDNYGLYKRDTYNYGWDIDHIIPSSSGLNEQEITTLNNYTNLKPLCSKINRDVKRDNYPILDT